MTFIETHSIQFLNLINAVRLYIQSAVVPARVFTDAVHPIYSIQVVASAHS